MINKFMPYYFYKRLWGDRANIKQPIDFKDKDWIKWEKLFSKIYGETINSQSFITNFGFNTLKKTNFTNKKILEIGPGKIRYLKYIKNNPLEFTFIDIENYFLDEATKLMKSKDIHVNTIKIKKNEYLNLPIEDSYFDYVFTFNNLEHIYKLENYLVELKRVIKPNGIIIGSIPCEGGLFWGLARYFTTRKSFYNKYKIDYDKIICWEHVNFADLILELLDKHFIKHKTTYYPSFIKSIDFNLIINFQYKCLK